MSQRLSLVLPLLSLFSLSAPQLTLAADTVKSKPAAKSDSPESTPSKSSFEIDPNRSFDINNLRANQSNTSAKSVSSNAFPLTKAFSASKEFNTKRFETSQFVPFSQNSDNSFSTRSFALPDSFSTKKFDLPDKSFTTKSFETGTGPVSVPNKTIPTSSSNDSGKSYNGVEADRMKLKFTPENAPKGGTISGRPLSVQDVKDILNKSK